MIHDTSTGVQGIPKNLLAYNEIPWSELDPLAAQMVSLGADNCRHEHLFYIAASLARISTNKRLVSKVLDLWLLSNKDLDQYLVSAINSAFALVYRPIKNYTSRNDTSNKNYTSLKKNQYAVLEALKSFEEKVEEPFAVSFSRLMNRTGLTKVTLLRIVKFLEISGFIEICQVGGSSKGKARCSNVYRISSSKS